MIVKFYLDTTSIRTARKIIEGQKILRSVKR